jgi:Family of unknown function (DUF6011)
MTVTANTAATETAEPVKCSRCKRTLRSASSTAAKIGPRCAAVEAATEGLSAKQVDKMAQLIIDKAIVATNRKGVFHVVNEAGEVVHTCHVNGNCTCEWGLRRKSAETKVCYMVGAARLLATPLIRKPRPAPAPIPLPAPADFWAEIERLNDAFMAVA